MKHLSRILAATVLAFCDFTYAGTPVLGFELGVSTIEQVTTTLSKATKVSDHGINKYSNGGMLKTNGASYEIQGLNEVLYIFDEQNKLMGVVMKMNKARFDPTFKILSSKYKVAHEARPFVGNQFAQFKTADGVVEINAPHMGFNMEVSYFRKDLLEKFKSQSRAEEAVKKKSEAAKF